MGEKYKMGAYVDEETIDKIKEYQKKYKEIFGTKATQGVVIDFVIKNADDIFKKYEDV